MNLVFCVVTDLNIYICTLPFCFKGMCSIGRFALKFVEKFRDCQVLFCMSALCSLADRSPYKSTLCCSRGYIMIASNLTWLSCKLSMFCVRDIWVVFSSYIHISFDTKFLLFSRKYALYLDLLYGYTTHKHVTAVCW